MDGQDGRDGVVVSAVISRPLCPPYRGTGQAPDISPVNGGNPDVPALRQSREQGEP